MVLEVTAQWFWCLKVGSQGQGIQLHILDNDTGTAKRKNQYVNAKC